MTPVCLKVPWRLTNPSPTETSAVSRQCQGVTSFRFPLGSGEMSPGAAVEGMFRRSDGVVSVDELPPRGHTSRPRIRYGLALSIAHVTYYF